MKRFILAFVLMLALLFAFISCNIGGNDDSSSGSSSSSSSNESSSSSSNESSSSSSDESSSSSSEESSSGEECASHTFGEWQETVPSSCTDLGEFRRYCEKCDKYESKSGSLKAHTIEIDARVEPTCTSVGKTEGSHCSVCKKVLKKQKEIPIRHEYEFDSYVNAPTATAQGSARFECVLCGDAITDTVSALEVKKLLKADVFDVETSENNVAEDNKWYIFDGNTDTVGIYNPGQEWFGSVGDTLTVTLSQQIVLRDLYLYTAGNWTIASVTVWDSYGNKTLEKSEVIANMSPFGGEGELQRVFENKSVNAYKIEIKILDNKDNQTGFKVTEMEIFGAKGDARLPHEHHFREYFSTVRKATCSLEGVDKYACYCGITSEVSTQKIDHAFDTLVSQSDATCEEDGLLVYECVCGETKEIVKAHKGHIYERFVKYLQAPTLSSKGRAEYKCIGCTLSKEKEVSALPLGEISYLRVDSISADSVKIKFNCYTSGEGYEIRYSDSEITEESFALATRADVVPTGTTELSFTLNLSVGFDKCHYVAVRAYSGTNYGEIKTLRLGGDKIIPIDYDSATVYHGEVQDSFEKLFDEQDEKYLNGVKTPSSVMSRIFYDSSDTELYGMSLSPIIDLEYRHAVSSAFLYFSSGAGTVKVRWSKGYVDFMAPDASWDGVASFSAKSGWNEVEIDEETRFIQVIYEDGSAPYEVIVKGYQCAEGDKIATVKRPLPTIGEMMGMCGFAAGGGGNTPPDSVICAPIMREYHHLEWTYRPGSYLGKSYFFNDYMGNFDTSYKSFVDAGIDVIACFQWDVYSGSVAHKVDQNGTPVKSGGKYVKASFWEKLSPSTYFEYSDAMFGFAARYGTNASSELLSIIAPRTEKVAKVGLGYVKWMELGNEPDGDWNGVHNYLSAYQLAAFTSAGYDGHGKTMTSSLTDSGYHLGVKNADPNMKVAMAGLAGIKNDYITAMLYWMKANREDGKIALDAFNVHHYMNKMITVGNATVSVGISPEEAGLVEELATLVEIRNKYYKDTEVWLSEFGWDTNQSYGTENSAHAYGDYTGRQVQAMWLTRAYLLLSASGVDKATMYMCEDTGNVESESVGKFATSGVIGFEYNKYGYIEEVKKDSYYYLYTLNTTLNDYTFEKSLETYDESVMAYEYKSADGKSAYALWCKTSDGTNHEGYKIKINADKATLVVAVYGDKDGERTMLVPDEYGYVTVDVSENPIYIVE